MNRPDWIGKTRPQIHSPASRHRHRHSLAGSGDDKLDRLDEDEERGSDGEFI